MTPPEERIFYVFGRTGAGKSAMANLISDTNLYKENHFGVSGTKNFQKESFLIDGILYTIIDTTGFGDTNIGTKEVLYKIAEGCTASKDKIHQILFVINNKFTQEEIQALSFLETLFYDMGIRKYTTIVRTHFPMFRDIAQSEADFAAMKEDNEKLKQILTSCNKLVHINNSPAVEDPTLENKKDSRVRLLMHLRSCRDTYTPPSGSSFHDRVASYKTPQELLEEREKEKKRVEKEQERLAKQIFNTKILNGYRLLLNRLIGIHPGACNRVEWAVIRGNAAQELQRANEVNITSSFVALLNVLGGIHPGACNTVEWSTIRHRCGVIRAYISTPQDVHRGLRELCSCFQGIHPGACNRVEWEAIRSTSGDVINQLN